jgi:hypothetical protein
MKDLGLGHGGMARGGHGLLKVSPGPAMPYSSMPCRQAHLASRFRGGLHTGQAACGHLIPHAVCYGLDHGRSSH